MSKSKDKRPLTRLDLPPPGYGPSKLKWIGGSVSDEFNNILLNQIADTLWLAQSDPDQRLVQIRAAVTAMTAVKPADELEGMLGVQLVATHNAAMECYRRAMIGEQSFEGRREALSQANKLVRSYATLVETLDRHRGKGQQRMTVEHVHVHQGAQAIVGTVTQGGGESSKSKDLPHGPALTHEPGTTLSGHIEAITKAVSVARG